MKTFIAYNFIQKSLLKYNCIFQIGHFSLNLFRLFIQIYILFQYLLLQGHWRFPSGKEMIGYAYILTHPGTPSVFYDHIFSPYKTEIASLISLRQRNGIHCRSTVSITILSCVPNLVLCKHFQGGRIRMNFFPYHIKAK